MWGHGMRVITRGVGAIVITATAVPREEVWLLWGLRWLVRLCNELMTSRAALMVVMGEDMWRWGNLWGSYKAWVRTKESIIIWHNGGLGEGEESVDIVCRARVVDSKAGIATTTTTTATNTTATTAADAIVTTIICGSTHAVIPNVVPLKKRVVIISIEEVVGARYHIIIGDSLLL